MDRNHSDTPKTELLIAAVLEEHRNCPIKGHILVVTDKKQVLLKHRKELLSSDVIIAKLNTKHIHIGLTARQWNDFSHAIIDTIENKNAARTDASLFNNS